MALGNFVEDAIALDVVDLVRADYLRDSRGWGHWSWPDHGGFNVRIQGGGTSILLCYQHMPDSGVNEVIRFWIAIAWRPCRFGGRRPWFVCSCERQVAKLYLVGRVFACQRCSGLEYRSRCEDRCRQLLRRGGKIRARLGGEPCLAAPFPNKPKWMRWKTYRRLQGAAYEAELVALQLPLSTRVKNCLATYG